MKLFLRTIYREFFIHVIIVKKIIIGINAKIILY